MVVSVAIKEKRLFGERAEVLQRTSQEQKIGDRGVDISGQGWRLVPGQPTA